MKWTDDSVSPSVVIVLPADLSLFDLVKCFAVYAFGGSGSCFETANANLYTTGFTEAIIIILNQLKRAVDLLD